jgi:hypothetical protein
VAQAVENVFFNPMSDNQGINLIESEEQPGAAYMTPYEGHQEL